MVSLVWQVLPASLPSWIRACSRCASPALEPTDRFRINANGPAHDVWLIYECPHCGAPHKRSLRRRVREAWPGELDPYRGNDSAAAALWALHLGRGQPLAHRVVRDALCESERVAVHVSQPHPCRVRWDRLLSAELGLSRSAIGRRWKVAFVPLTRPFEARAVVRDGDGILLALDESGGGPMLP
ncbi:MAG: DUF1062 domain-containing protein [Myxococcota bacterium]|nr:DUF1062 domain-containing protein [Myxococcota bacterium]